MSLRMPRIQWPTKSLELQIFTQKNSSFNILHGSDYIHGQNYHAFNWPYG